ncbi:MAG: Asp23/Gls24 family envelope stress response protein [Candidatus Sumerlaeota bacterium]|nr:Asp23/Gls24 family envelope stress response protein [Candidatus Sumerlaeota bacterium]
MAVNENLGDIKIQNEVVATIASIATAEVEGIVSLSGKRFLDPLRSQKGPDKGIKVEVEENRAKITVDIKVVYGNVIYDTAHRLQQRIKNAVEQMTGLIVDSVEVNVRDIVLDSTARKGGEESDEDNERE